MGFSGNQRIKKKWCSLKSTSNSSKTTRFIERLRRAASFDAQVWPYNFAPGHRNWNAARSQVYSRQLQGIAERTSQIIIIWLKVRLSKFCLNNPCEKSVIWFPTGVDFEDWDLATDVGTAKPLSMALWRPGHPSWDLPFAEDPSRCILKLEMRLL